MSLRLNGVARMMHDVRLVLWLRIRHVRTAVSRLFHAVGADPLADDSLGERVYQLYAAAIMVVWVVLMWAALLDGCAAAFIALGPALSATVFSAALLAPALILAVSGFKAMRTSPLKLTHPDIPFVAASPLNTRSLVAVGAARTMALGCVTAGFVGFALGVGLNSGMGGFITPLSCALVAALLVAVALVGVWLAGIARLALVQKGWGTRVLLALVLAVAVVGAALVLMLVVQPVLVTSGGVALVCVWSFSLVCGEVLVLIWLAPRIDMTVVIQENVLFADLQQFGMFSPLDQTTISDYRRRRKLAARGPLLRMPVATGRGALVARAVISLVRQYEALPGLLMQGALAAPLGVITLFGGGEPVLLLFWLAALVMFPNGVRPATRAFRDDMRVRLVRDRLPFGTLELLVFDSFPAFILVNVVSSVMVVLTLPAHISLAMGLLGAVLINAAVTLSCGLDAISLFRGGPRPIYEIGVIVLVAVAGVLSFTGQPWLVLVGMATVCGVVALVVQGGIEHAR